MFPGTCVDMGWADEKGDQSRVRIHKSCKPRAGVEVSTDPSGEAYGCLHYFMLLDLVILGLKLLSRGRKDGKEPHLRKS